MVKVLDDLNVMHLQHSRTGTHYWDTHNLESPIKLYTLPPPTPPPRNFQSLDLLGDIFW